MDHAKTVPDYAYSVEQMEIDVPVGIWKKQAGTVLPGDPLPRLTSDRMSHRVEQPGDAPLAAYCDYFDDPVIGTSLLQLLPPTMLYARFLALSKKVPRGAQHAANVLLDLDERDVANAIVAIGNASDSATHWQHALYAIAHCSQAWQPALIRLVSKKSDVVETHLLEPLEKALDPLLCAAWGRYNNMRPGERRYAGLGDLVLARAEFERFPLGYSFLPSIISHCHNGLPIAYWGHLLEGYLEHAAQTAPIAVDFKVLIKTYLRACGGTLPVLPTSVRSLLAQASYRSKKGNVRAMWQNTFGVSDAVLREDWDPMMARLIAKEEEDSAAWMVLRPHQKLKPCRDPYPLPMFPQALDALHHMPSEKRDLPMQARCERWSPDDPVFLEMTKLRHLYRVEKHLRQDFFYLIPPAGNPVFMTDMSERIKRVIARVEHETLNALILNPFGQHAFLAWLDKRPPPTCMTMWRVLVKDARKMVWQAQPRLLERLSQPLSTLKFKRLSIPALRDIVTSWRDSIVLACRVNKTMHLAAYAFEGALRVLIVLGDRSGHDIRKPIALEMKRIFSELPACHTANLLSQLQDYLQKSMNTWPMPRGDDPLREHVNLLLRDPKSTATSLSPGFQCTLISQAGLMWQALPDHPAGGREKVTAFAARFGMAHPDSDAVLRQCVDALMAPVIKCEVSMDTVLSNAGLNDGLARRYADEFLWCHSIKPALEHGADVRREIANFTAYPENVLSMHFV
jgi:hypothetical protein